MLGDGGYDIGSNFLPPYGESAAPCSQTSALADLYSSTVTVSGEAWASDRTVTGGLSGKANWMTGDPCYESWCVGGGGGG